MNYGFIRVASAIPSVRPGNCKYNTECIINLLQQAEKKHVDIVCFPELCITGYTCQDLFESETLLKGAENSLKKLCEKTRSIKAIAIVGLPVTVSGVLMNCAAVLYKGEIMGIVPKTFLPNYKEFYERRWFASASDVKKKEIELCGKIIPFSSDLIFKTSKATFGIEICEDLWAPIPRSSRLALAGAEIIFNPSADNECVGKNTYLQSMISGQSARTLSGYVFSSCGFGESTQDVVFAGNAIICENGNLLSVNKRFCFEEKLVYSEIDVELLRHERRVNTTFGSCAASEKDLENFTTIYIKDHETYPDANLSRYISPSPFIPKGKDLEDRCREIINIQIEGLAKRFVHTKAKTAVIGVSGGLDSTLALLICAFTFDKINIDRKNIIGVTMPGFGTSKGTHSNALDLMAELGITIREISINTACTQHFKDIGHNPEIHDTTYENSQARERTQILMDVANQTNGLVIGTGDLSELALGWATYNGDHMSMYGVNCSIPKTLIRHLIKWISDNTTNIKERQTLIGIINTPISPELIPTNQNGEIAQKTEDTIGPYELHDFFIYYTLRYGFSPAKTYFLAQNAFGKKPIKECDCKCEETFPEEEVRNYYDNETIKHWLKIFFKRFFAQQFKRSCLPDGPKVGSCSLSPRGDWRMPSDADASAWIEECERL